MIENGKLYFLDAHNKLTKQALIQQCTDMNMGKIPTTVFHDKVKVGEVVRALITEEKLCVEILWFDNMYEHWLEKEKECFISLFRIMGAK